MVSFQTAGGGKRTLLVASAALLLVARPVRADPVAAAVPVLAVNVVGLGFGGYDIYKGFAGERCSRAYSIAETVLFGATTLGATALGIVLLGSPPTSDVDTHAFGGAMLILAVIPSALTVHGVWQLTHQPDELAVIPTKHGLVIAGRF